MASTALSTEVREGGVPAKAKPVDVFRTELELRRAMFAPMLPNRVPWDKFVATVCTAVTFNLDLLECDRGSLLRAAATAAELGLSMNPAMGECDILKVWNNRTRKYEAQCRPRVKGMMKLARNSGEITMINAQVVHENDFFEWELGLVPKLVHKPAKAKRGEMTHCYCVWKTTDGEVSFEVMDREQVYKIRGRTSSKNKEGQVVGPWITDEDEMWRKTVVKRSTKYMPLSAEALQKAAKVDNLHEAGDDYDLDHGEIVANDSFAGAMDITGSDDDEQPAGNSQVDALEGKVVGRGRARQQQEPDPGAAAGFGEHADPEPKKEPKPAAKAKPEPKPEAKAEPEKPAIPVIEAAKDSKNRVNWSGYVDDVIEALKPLDADTVAAWQAANQQTIGELEFEQPALAQRLADELAMMMGA